MKSTLIEDRLKSKQYTLNNHEENLVVERTYSGNCGFNSRRHDPYQIRAHFHVINTKMRITLVIICVLSCWNFGNGEADGNITDLERSRKGRPQQQPRETVTEVTQVNGDQICEKIRTQYTGNVVWRCKNESDCPIPIKYLEHWKTLTYCGVSQHPEETEPMVCCPYKAPDKTIQSPEKEESDEPSLSAVSPKNDWRNIAREKCEEYSKFRYVTKSVGGNIRGTSKVIKRFLDCGKGTRNLIMGGKEASEKEFPHMVLLGYGDTKTEIEWNCGGSLISSNYVLSAAHCNSNHAMEWALLGQILRPDTSQKVNENNLYHIEARFTHPKYNSLTHENDIVLLKLDRTVKFNPSIRPICLVPPSVVTSTPKELTATGWGATEPGSIESDVLLKVELDRLEDNLCETTYKQGDNHMKNGFDAKTMMCAGSLEHQRDTCKSDSGGPLQYTVNHSDYKCVWVQEGITSVGPSFCGNREPAIYTRVSAFLPWIQPIVWPLEELTHP